MDFLEKNKFGIIIGAFIIWLIISIGLIANINEKIDSQRSEIRELESEKERFEDEISDLEEDKLNLEGKVSQLVDEINSQSYSVPSSYQSYPNSAFYSDGNRMDKNDFTQEKLNLDENYNENVKQSESEHSGPLDNFYCKLLEETYMYEFADGSGSPILHIGKNSNISVVSKDNRGGALWFIYYEAPNGKGYYGYISSTSISK